MGVNGVGNGQQGGKLGIGNCLRRLLARTRNRQTRSTTAKPAINGSSCSSYDRKRKYINQEAPNPKRQSKESLMVFLSFPDSISSFPAFLICFSGSLDLRWNLRRTRCFSAPIRRRELSPLSWARPAQFVFIAAKQMDRQPPMSSRSIRSYGPTATLSILGSRRKNYRAISGTAG